MKTWIFASVWMSVLCLVSQAVEWTSYQGPNRNGVLEGAAWNSVWPAGGPEELWRINVGHGYSEVVSVGGRAYTMGYDPETGEDRVVCIDIRDGGIAWERRYKCKPMDFLHKGGPAATPLIENGKVYTVSKEAHLHCFDAATGEVIWMRDLKENPGVKLSACGESSSPLMVDGKLIVDAGIIAAFEPDTGEVVWKTRDYEAAYAAPSVFEQGGETRIAAFPGEGVVILNAADGAERALFPLRKSMRTVYSSMPIYYNRSIYVSSNHRKGGIRIDVSEDGKPREIWNNERLQTVVNSAIPFGGRLYTSIWKQTGLACVNPESGAIEWISDALGGGPFIIVDGKIIAVSGQGELLLAEFGDQTINVLSRKPLLFGNCWTSPSLSGGYLFCRNENGDVVCLDARPGENAAVEIQGQPAPIR